jgi:tripartite-type tricarboxylate transporter receptor subunit TctC
MRRPILIVTLACLLPIFAGAGTAWAQDYPTRPIEYVIPFPPGGPTDTGARIILPQLQAILKVPIAAVNKSGAGGAVGADYAAKAKPDGYTIFAGPNAPLSIATASQKDLTYTIADFAPLGSYAADLSVIVSRANAPWKTLEEMVAFAKKNPGKLKYASAGVGTVSHFTVELMKVAYGIDIAHVPFQGTAPAKNAILGGHVDLASSGFAAFAPVIKSGDLIALVTSAAKRVPAFPTVPTFAEKGTPGASLNIWLGLYVPAKTPRPIVDKLSAALAQAARDPQMTAGLEKAGMFPDYRDAAGTRKLLEEEYAAVRSASERLGIGK